jgi:monoamine oxidase
MGPIFDVIVVGAGFSGLNAAHILRSQGKHVLVLEARDRVGGRTKCGQIAGLNIDLGGMWFAPGQKRLVSLANDMGIESYPTFLEGKSVQTLAGKYGLVTGENFTEMLTFSEKLCSRLLFRKINRLLSRIDDVNPWQGELARKLDALSVEAWLLDAVGSERLRALIRGICTSFFCAQTTQVSLLFFLVYVKNSGGLELMTSAAEGGGQNLLFYGGVHQIAEHMAKRLGSALCINEPVYSVDVSQSIAVVGARSSSFLAKKVIITIPSNLIDKIKFTPGLPNAQAKLHKKVTMGSVIKFWVAYPTPFWRECGLNGSILRDDQAVSPCFDVSPPNGNIGLIAGFFEGDRAIVASDLTEQQRRDLVLDTLTEHFGELARNPLDYVDVDWTKEEWSKGCYGTFAPPGVMSLYGAWLQKPHRGIYWAGTETATQWPGYIEGALQAGERAAHEVLGL